MQKPEKFVPAFKLQSGNEIKHKTVKETLAEQPAPEADPVAGELTAGIELIKEHVNEYARMQQARGNMNLFVALHERTLSITPPSTLIVTLSSQLQKDLFEQTKTELATFLRSKPGCEAIRTEAVIDEDAKETAVNAKFYTNKEKYARMLEKYPLLADLQKTLGLEPEY